MMGSDESETLGGKREHSAAFAAILTLFVYFLKIFFTLHEVCLLQQRLHPPLCSTAVFLFCLFALAAKLSAFVYKSHFAA